MIDLEKLLNGIKLQHGRKMPVHSDIYNAGMGYYYVSFRRQLKPAEIEALRPNFARVEFVYPVHRGRDYRYMLVEGMES